MARWRVAACLSIVTTTLVVVTPPAPAVGAAPAPTLLTISRAPYDDLVADGNDHAYAASSSQNQVDVLRISTRSLEAPIPVPSPVAIDLSPDGTTLYVASSGSHEVVAISTSLRTELRRYDIGAEVHDLAVASNGAALVAVGDDGPFDVTYRQLNLTTGAVRDRGRIGAIIHDVFSGTDVEMNTFLVKSSADHSRLLFFGGAYVMYDAATDTLSEGRAYDLLASFSPGLDASGSTVVAGGRRGSLHLDERLDVEATLVSDELQQGEEAFAVSADGTRAYRAFGGTVDVLDLALGRAIATITIPDTAEGRYPAVLSADGSTLVVATLHGIVLAPVSAAVPLPACTPGSPAPMVLRVCGRLTDVVVDGHGHAYAANPERNQVEVVSLATGTFEAPIPVGSQPHGLDLSPDGTTLYVTNWGASDISVVDTATRTEVRRIEIPPGWAPYRHGPLSIAVADNGTALLTTNFENAHLHYASQFLQLDLATGALRPRPDLDLLQRQTDGPTTLKASPDHSLIVGAVRTRTSPEDGLVMLYRSADDSITPWTPTAGSAPLPGGAAVGGSRILALPGAILGTDLTPQTTIPGGGTSVVVDAAGTTGYRVHDTSVDVLDLIGGVATGSVALPEPVGGGRGMAALTPDGSEMAVLTASGLSVVAVGPIPTPPKSAYAVWSQPTPAALDAVGAWVVPVNVPAAGSGQLPPSYLHAHYFNFTQSPSALGVVGLVTSAGTRLAAFGIVDGGGTAHSVGLAFEWQAGRAYYLFAAQLSPSTFGGWVYDYTAAAWTFVGQVNLPAPLGKIGPATVTQTIWFGPTAATCTSYPRAEAYFYPPVGYAGGGTAEGTMATSATSATGTCPATATTELPPWIHLHLGADPA